MTTQDKNEAIRAIANHYGIFNQLIKSFEELGEVQAEIARFLLAGDNAEHLSEEIADAMIMLLQIVHLTDSSAAVDGYIDFKLRRQLARMEEEE